ncbi:MAG TPA: DUF6092 family protein [Methylomirabilota bacterium]|jgi:hypothetical protein
MAGKMVLSEDEALELVAFLVTAARTQIDEAAEYGPLRLLTAAGRLAELIAERVSPETRAFLTGPLKQIPDLAVRTADPGRPFAGARRRCGHVVQPGGGERGLERAHGPQPGDVGVPRPPRTEAAAGHADTRTGDLGEPDAVGAFSEREVSVLSARG